jgi:hypothetical protein
LDTAVLKSSNVTAAFVYGDGQGGWWGDVVVKKGKGSITIGVPEHDPCHSYDEALECIKRNIANIKAMREHPLVKIFRGAGYDPQRITLLRVERQGAGLRFIVCRDEEVPTQATLFEERWKLTGGNEVVDFAVKLAKSIILHFAEEFSGPVFLAPPSERPGRSEDEVNMWREAAAFLIGCGVINIRDQDETDVLFGVVSGIPDDNGEYPVDYKLPPALINSIGGSETPQ